ncbi:MAG: 16S rRNA (cytosine(967)-C(5))-methyltransferase RsmB [Lachnospiraceae bacterium]|nr:16S rRNA (cytosine(967)-C(5))-methyltransferase RsmB [Lachnospiraceae bacterium]
MAANEREIILDCLIEINEKGALSHIALRSVLEKYDHLSPNSKAFIKRVVEGTVENQITIDGIIDSYSKVRTGKQKPLIRTLLRMSVYQIMYLDKVPESAVINEAVKLVKKRGFTGLSGFVNGVLRTISKNSEKIRIEDKDVPEWIREHLISCYGEEKTGLILEDINKIHPVTVRLRGEGADPDALEETGILPFAYYLKGRRSPADIKGFKEGAFVIQDVAGMHVCLMADIKEGDKVLDLCAAPGMKALQAYDMGADVTACDISEKKTGLIVDNIRRCVKEDGESRIRTMVSDATVFEPGFENKFDKVICDVPCSGLGVMGRKSDIRHKTKKEDLDELFLIQRKILDNAVRYVKDGGRLIYSTCTMNPGENEENAAYIADRYGFVLEKERQFLPGIDKTDGFYIAVLDKPES